MPKKPRKTRVGSNAWSAQIARDKARYEAEQAMPKAKKEAPKRQRWARPEPRAEPRQEPRSEPRQEPRSEPRQGPRAEPRRPMTAERRCHLAILGLQPWQDTLANIKVAYRRLALLFHPDKNPALSAAARMKAVNCANDYLTKD